MATVLPRRPRSWTPKAIPFGLLILLLGLWAFFAPLLGGYFGFGFSSGATWQFSARQWELQLAPGIVAASASTAAAPAQSSQAMTVDGPRRSERFTLERSTR